MNSSSKIFLSALKGHDVPRAPFWFMRQAGRYLPEYRELRSKSKSFLDFCYTPEMACEATLQPIKRFGMDAAIIFSDILVIPDAMGAEVTFEEGFGPRIVPIKNESYLDDLSLDRLEEKLQPVYEALAMTKAELDDKTALIGFCGAPWTLACYMVDGKGTRSFERTRKAAKEDALFFERLISLLTKAVIRHLDAQVKAGAEAVQLFDSWAGLLNEEAYMSWVIEPTIRIVTEFKKLHPDVPMIGFPRQSGIKFSSFVRETKIDAVSFDNSVPAEWAKSSLQTKCVVQGSLLPELLADNKKFMLREAEHLLSVLGGKPFVFNLSHGILPRTPVENMAALCDFLKEQGTK